MFGKYKIPFQVEQNGISLGVSQAGEFLLYERTCLGKELKKNLLTNTDKVFLRPIEPVNVPKPIAQHLFIDFNRDVLLEPGIKRSIYLTFPIEIGVFVRMRRHFELMDSFSQSKQKFILYGNPNGGTLCKYWPSEVFDSPPEVSLLQTGVMELNMENGTDEWAQVSRAVFSAVSMKLFYSKTLVSMNASMKIMSQHIASTGFRAAHFDPETKMKKSVKTYLQKKLAVAPVKFEMMDGF